MENYVAAQLQQLGAAAALGGAAGLVYDVLRSARLLDRRDRRLTHLLDGVFAALLGAGLLWLALVVGEGELRLYMGCCWARSCGSACCRRCCGLCGTSG